MLHEHEIEQLVLMLAAGQESFTEEEATKVIDWATNVRIDQGLLENVLAGHATIAFKGDELTFKITEKGIEKANLLSERRNVRWKP